MLAITCGDDNQIIVLDLHKYHVLASVPICTKEFSDGDGGSGKPGYSDLKQTLFPYTHQARCLAVNSASSSSTSQSGVN
jgi:hypothetical protein